MESRIYVVVPHHVQVGSRLVKISCGRAAAQAAHAVAKMQAATKKDVSNITTIILGCRDSAELDHVNEVLFSKAIERYFYLDEDILFYGTEASVYTALCTVPIEFGYNPLQYLPLWSCE
jgi:hypothetical protein